MIEIVSSTPEVVIDLDVDTAKSLNRGDLVGISIEKKTFTGTITAISRTAGENLLYTTRISVPDGAEYIGSAASIVFTASRESTGIDTHQSISLPLKSVKIISEQE